MNFALQRTKTQADVRASSILTLLLQISVVAGARRGEKQAAEIDRTARTCLGSVLGIVPAAEFVSSVTTLLTGAEDKGVSIARTLSPGESPNGHSDKIWHARSTSRAGVETVR